MHTQKQSQKTPAYVKKIPAFDVPRRGSTIVGAGAAYTSESP